VKLVEFRTKMFVCQVRVKRKWLRDRRTFPTGVLECLGAVSAFLVRLGRSLVQIMHTECAWCRIYEIREIQ